MGDDPAAVAENRRRVRRALSLPREPLWLEQVHGARVADADAGSEAGAADAAVSRAYGRVLAIQVADCLPVLFASQDGAVVAAAHAGWRGLAAGVLEATIAGDARAAGSNRWPGSGRPSAAEHFEVGEEVRAAFLAHDPALGRRLRRQRARALAVRLAAACAAGGSRPWGCVRTAPRTFAPTRRAIGVSPTGAMGAPGAWRRSSGARETGT